MYEIDYILILINKILLIVKQILFIIPASYSLFKFYRRILKKSTNLTDISAWIKKS